jgi:predicted glycosyltransferase
MQDADLVLGAGGTMTREAALLGVPTFTLFAGERPAVDRWLEQQGMLRRLESVDDLLPVRRRSDAADRIGELRRRGEHLVAQFVDVTLEAARARRG